MEILEQIDNVEIAVNKIIDCLKKDRRGSFWEDSIADLKQGLYAKFIIRILDRYDDDVFVQLTRNLVRELEKFYKENKK